MRKLASQCSRWLLLAMHVFACQYSYADPQQDLYLDAIKSMSEGRKNDASDTLMRLVEQEPQHAGAWLDLAIIQCELGHSEEAERLFKAIESRFSPPPAIMEVISRQRAQGCKATQARINTTISIARGNDSNVNQGASSQTFSIGSSDFQVELQLLPEYLPHHDQYTALSAEVTRNLGNNGVVSFAQFQVRQNDQYNRYNTASTLLGVERPWSRGGWNLNTTGAVGILALGGKVYQEQEMLQFNLMSPLQPFESMQWNWLATAAHLRYPSLTNFGANTLEVRSILNYRKQSTEAYASLGYIEDHATAARPGGNRAGWNAALFARTAITSNLSMEAATSWQYWNGQGDYSPGLIDQIRRERTQNYRAGLILRTGNSQSWKLEVREVRNDENIAIFQYNSHQLQLSWQWENN